jgi:hypothetical protein
VAVPPGLTEAVFGVPEIVKSGPATFIVTLVTCVSDPLVPFSAIVEFPIGVPLDVVTLRVALPEVVMVAGENDAVAPIGSPVALRITWPVNPPSAPTFTVYVVVALKPTVLVLGVAEMLKSGLGGAIGTI